MPKVNDGTTETCDDNHVFAVCNEQFGTVEVKDNLGRRVGVVPGFSQQAFRACSSAQSSNSSLDGTYGPFWVPTVPADTGGSDQGTTTYRMPIHMGATIATTVDIDAATLLLSGNTLSTLLLGAGADGDSLSCASTLGAGYWTSAASHIQEQLDTVLTNWFAQAASAFSSPFIELENTANRIYVSLVAGGLAPALGYADMQTAGTSFGLTSQSTDYEDPGTTEAASAVSVWNTSEKPNRFGKYVISSAVIQVGGSLDFDVAAVLPHVGGAATTISTYAHTTGNMVSFENRSRSNTIEVQDSYGHRLHVLKPYTGAVFYAHTTNVSTADLYDGAEQWSLTNCRLIPGAESMAETNAETLKSTTTWGPLDLSTVLPQVSCLASNITTMTTATYSSATDTTAYVAAMEYVLGQLASQNFAAMTAVCDYIMSLNEMTAALDIVEWST
jgi:hypothetical protein